MTATTAAFTAADGKAKAAAAVLAPPIKQLVDQQAAAKVLADTAAKTKADGEAKVKDADAKRAAAATAAQIGRRGGQVRKRIVDCRARPVACRRYSLAIRGNAQPRPQRVIATTVTAPQRFAAVTPIGIALTSPPQLSAKLDAKTGAKLIVAGKLQRLPEFKGDATVTLSGLPPGIGYRAKCSSPT